MPERILVVDDVPVNVKLLADLLAVKGYTVVTAAGGAEALEKVDKEQPALVLLDVMMPGMSGYDVCRKIRQNPATAMLPVIMVTALDPTQERVKGIDAGADDFLTKPINQPELLARVKSLLRIKLLHDELADWNRTLERRVEQHEIRAFALDRLQRLPSRRRGDHAIAFGRQEIGQELHVLGRVVHDEDRRGHGRPPTAPSTAARNSRRLIGFV